MSSDIHPTAIIEDGAELAEDITIGPYAYIGPEVKIGKDTCIHHHATVDGLTEIGQCNEIFPYAFIGGKTHDLKYTGGTPGLKIGNHNTFREYCSIHLATHEGDFTQIGNNNVFLAYSHVAHECIVSNNVIMSSHTALGGHVRVGDHANIGWGTGIHQFCSIGAHAMCGACSKVVQDVMPFMIADGNPASVRTINKVGMERNGFKDDDIQAAKYIQKLFYREGHNRSQAISLLRESPKADNPISKHILAFLEQATRGLA